MAKRNNDVEFVKNLIKNVSIRTNVAQLGRVISYANENHSKVNVQPLALNKSGTKRGMLLNVHIGRLLREVVQVGDVVVILFMDRSLENWNGSNSDFVLTSERMHDVNDAFIVEVY
ncbi:ABC transporter substrate-binding protein [Latilactobacillus curvatus]|uniref:ABC transporter substrate-binding protein n=1 Tax=Latilactobacillus curvatus TaxID=28038 RepID=A0AAC9UNN6_LATCU|nr:hypothetical protein [Latilactobacillus curvatus]ASN59841.1 ABC transporter substrate-binding protein [Latilactobacillus curvatus]